MIAVSRMASGRMLIYFKYTSAADGGFMNLCNHRPEAFTDARNELYETGFAEDSAVSFLRLRCSSQNMNTTPNDDYGND